MSLRRPIMYLEKSDFTSDGNLVSSLQRTPIFVMFQASFCGHCTTAKPAFQRLAEEGRITCMTIQGDEPKQKDLMPMLDKIYPGFQGYPSYMLFIYGTKIPYNGERDLDSLRDFVQNFV